MKLQNYIITWAFLLLALTVGVTITVFNAVTRKDAVTFKWRAFWQLVKKGDMMQ